MTESICSAEKKFTAKYIRALKCPVHVKQQYVLLLPDVHLYVSVARAGTKAFCFRAKQSGNWRTLDLNCRFDETLPDSLIRGAMVAAQNRATDLTSQRNRGEDVFELAKQQNNSLTLQELFDHYKVGHLDKRSKRSGDAVKDFKRWFGKHANKKVTSFTYQDAYKLHTSMSQKTPVSANRAVQLGRAMFNFGIKTRFVLADNPFAGISLNRETERDRVLTDEEAGKLLSALESIPATHSDERNLRDWVLLSLMTGARKANILSMRWDEITFDNGTWTIPAKKMKTNQAQIIPLSAFEISLLKERRQLLIRASIASPWVFPGTGSSGHIVDPGNAWESLRARLGLGDLWIHDLRRSLASSMANSGADVSIVRAALNHTDTRTTLKAYIRTTQQVQLQAREKAQRAWLAAMEQQEDSVVRIPKKLGGSTDS